MATTESSAPAHPPTDHQRILQDARQRPDRTHRQHVAAAQEIAAESYRAELRKLAALDMLDPSEADEL